MTTARLRCLATLLLVSLGGCKILQVGMKRAAQLEPQMDAVIDEFVQHRLEGNREAMVGMMGAFSGKSAPGFLQLLSDLEESYGACSSYESVGLGAFMQGWENPQLKTVTKTIRSQCEKGDLVEKFIFAVQMDGSIRLESYRAENPMRLFHRYLQEWWYGEEP